MAFRPDHWGRKAHVCVKSCPIRPNFNTFGRVSECVEIAVGGASGLGCEIAATSAPRINNSALI